MSAKLRDRTASIESSVSVSGASRAWRVNDTCVAQLPLANLANCDNIGGLDASLPSLSSAEIRGLRMRDPCVGLSFSFEGEMILRPRPRPDAREMVRVIFTVPSTTCAGVHAYLQARHGRL